MPDFLLEKRITRKRALIDRKLFTLQNLEFIAPVRKSNTRVEKEYELYEFLLTSHQVAEAIKNYPNLPTEIEQWAPIDDLQ